MSAPVWSSVDDDRADLLSLVAMGSSTGDADREWDFFLDVLATVASRHAGRIDPNELRPLLRGRIAPRRISGFTSKAGRDGIIRYTGDFVISDDVEGGNRGKPARVMEWIGENA